MSRFSFLETSFDCKNCGKHWDDRRLYEKHLRRTPNSCGKSLVAKIAPIPRVDYGVKVPCILAGCGLQFPNAIELGLHQTKDHFFEEYPESKRESYLIH